MKRLRDRALNRYRSAQIDFLQYLDTQYWYNEANGWFEMAREQASHTP
ncbi:MAG: hypothetical protein ACP5XB_13020 [Isosphaeraceae bacterium]